MRLIAVLLLCLLSGLSAAETAYVTDQLRLGLHRAEDTSDRAFRMLESGQAMEILSRTTNYARVRLPDGGEGYVKAAYLVTDKPARLIVQETQAEAERLRGELAALEQAFSEPADTIRALEADVRQLQAALEAAQAEATASRDIQQRLEARAERYKYSLPYSWVLAAAIICLVAGVLAGLWWFDYRSRKRHGGIRIY